MFEICVVAPFTFRLKHLDYFHVIDEVGRSAEELVDEGLAFRNLGDLHRFEVLGERRASGEKLVDHGETVFDLLHP